MRHFIIPVIITAAVAANSYSLVLNYTKPYPRPIITITGEHTHFVKAINMAELLRRVQYMGQRGWKCRTSPSVISPFAVVAMYKPVVLMNGMVIHPDGSVVEVLKKWERIDTGILQHMPAERKQKEPDVDDLHDKIIILKMLGPAGKTYRI